MTDYANKVIVFAQDTAERKRFFRAASFSHPAKMILGLQIYLIEHYTKPGDTILDPMAGSGTILVACTLGRNVICVELEDKFVKMQQANYEKIKRLGPMLGHVMGEAVILQGDSRNLPDVLADKVIFSPPYAEAENRDNRKYQDGHVAHMMGRSYLKSKHGQTKGQISNLPYGTIDKIVTSPPYENQPNPNRTNHGILNHKENCKCNFCKKNRSNAGMNQGYRKADVVISSPPYEGSLQGKPGIDWNKCKDGRDYTKEPNFKARIARHSGYTDLDPSIERLRKHGRTDPGAGGPYGRSLAHPYSGAEENIGNLKSENYLSAMLQIYQKCHKVLKEKGLLVLVTKNFIRNKEIVRLDSDTIKLCEQAGFTLIKRLKRKLTSQSFWRRIYMQKFPDAPKIEYEDVLVFEKNP